MFCNRVVTGAIQCGRIVYVQLFLACFRFALEILDRDTGGIKVIAEAAHNTLFLDGLEDVVVFVIAADRLQVAKPALADLIKAFVEQKELRLGCHHRVKPQSGKPGHLRLQNGTWEMGNGLMPVMIEYIAQNFAVLSSHSTGRMVLRSGFIQAD